MIDNNLYRKIAQKNEIFTELTIKKQIEDLKKFLPKKERSRKKLPRFLIIEEYRKIIDFLKKKKGKKKYQYLIAFILAFEGGMRISEIVGLKNKDGSWKIEPLTQDRIDLQAHTIKIIAGKGRKDRIVPLPKSFNERALKFLPLRIKRRTLQWMASQITEKILNKKLTFHSFRHGFGSHLANSGRPLHEIQMLMGHSRLDSTGIYLHANPKQAIEGAREVF